MKARRRTRAPLGFVWRLAASLGLVVLSGGATLLGVALVVAPAIFQSHLRMAMGSGIEPGVQTHVNEAFANAVFVSLGVAMPVALLTASGVTWIVARRLAGSVAAVAAAADRIARGNLDARVEAPAIGPEFTQLADSFNAMAARLAETETTRRRLIGDLAHELRTPLASLDATVEAVVDGALPADNATLATLTEQTLRLQHLVADMGAVSRAEERQLDLHPQHVNLAALATEAVAAARARYAAAGRRLDIEVVGSAPIVLVDRQRLAETVANLLDNALRHTPADGTVRVVVDAEPTGATLKVIDTGEGFDPSNAERLFERFYRADTSRTRTTAGSGVGLTIARAIVQAHGGTLTASSNGPGTGATFRIHFPTHSTGRYREHRRSTPR
ncbi:HAMP domain-containing sensor histidine kinase [soil metagenome]|jgi:two-component system sensor histidine kinase BaeS